MDPIDRQLDAYNARDLERFLECYAEDVEVKDANGDVVMVGREAVAAMYGTLFQQSPALHCTVGNRIRVGRYVIDEEHVTGFVLEGFPEEVHAAVVYQVGDGLIRKVQLLM